MSMKENPFHYTTQQLLELFPELKPSTIDYLVRDRIISAKRRGRGLTRLYDEECLSKIRQFLNKRKQVEVKNDTL